MESTAKLWLTFDEARQLTGHKNARAFKRWAQMSGVRIYHIGRMERVTAADINKAVRRAA